MAGFPCKTPGNTCIPCLGGGKTLVLGVARVEECHLDNSNCSPDQSSTSERGESDWVTNRGVVPYAKVLSRCVGWPVFGSFEPKPVSEHGVSRGQGASWTCVRWCVHAPLFCPL